MTTGAGGKGRRSPRAVGSLVVAIVFSVTTAAADDLDDLFGVPGSAGSDSVEPDEVASPDAAGPPGDAAVSPAGTPAAETTPSRTIDEIVVTAQRTEQALSDVPISITAFSGDDLREIGIDNLHELAEFVPNVRLTTNACCTTVFIRGFGTPFGVSTFDPAVALALDDLSIPKDVFMSDALFDIERFEVLRGPQGTLFGKNTPAGLFNVTTGLPSDELSGFVIGRVGGLGVHRIEAAIGGPVGGAVLGDIARFRLAVADVEQAGDVRNTELDVREPATKQRAGRLKLALGPWSGLDVLLIAERSLTDSRFFHIQQHELRDSSVDFLRRFDPEFEDDGLNHQDSINLDDELDRRTDRLQSNIRYGLGNVGFVRDAEVVAVVGHTGFDQDAPGDVDWSPAEVFSLSYPNLFEYDQLSAEIRAGGFLPGIAGIGELEFLAGFLWFRSNTLTASRGRAGPDLDEYLLSPPAFELITGSEPPGGVGFPDLGAVTSLLGVDPIGDADLLEDDGFLFFSDQDVVSYAVFGRLAWHLTPQWTVDFGGRLTFETKDALLENTCFEPGVVCGALGVEEFRLNRKRSETDFSPKVTLQYFPWDDLSLFATRAQGFKSGGFNNFSFTSDAIEVEPERAVSWEVGARGRLFSGSLFYSATFFNMEVEDLQLQNLTGGVVQTRNAASARSRGVELDFRWLTPFEPLGIRGAGAWTDGTFLDFPDAPAVAGSGAESQDLSGKSMPFVPDWQLSVSPEVRVGVTSPFGGFVPRDWVARLTLDILYRSAQFLDIDLDRNTIQDSYAMLDVRTGLETADGALALDFAVRNVTDTDAFELLIDSLFYPGGYMGLQEFQRNAIFEVRYQW